MTPSITDFFPGTPIAEQVPVLQEFQRAYPAHRLIVIRAPVAFGKSWVAATIMDWLESLNTDTAYCVPNAVLQKQVERDFPWMASVWGAKKFSCAETGKSCAKVKVKCDRCPYYSSLARARTSSTKLMNWYTMLGLRKTLGYPYTVIFDEAHKLVDFLRDGATVRLWQHEHHYPEGLSTAEDVVAWIEGSYGKPGDPTRKKARRLILKDPDNVLLEETEELYRGKPAWCLKVTPLDLSHQPPTLWPKSVKRVVLMSATLRESDIYELGLNKYFGDPYFIDAPSPIPAPRRPIYHMPFVDVSHGTRDLAVEEVADYVTTLLTVHQGPGLVHVTYDELESYRAKLTDPRFLWHTRQNKQQVFYDWIGGRAGPNRVLVGAGFHEGVDLKGDRAKWQVVTKVPFPSLGDRAVAAKAAKDPEWYDWQAVKDFLQTVGRVCRSPEDFGATYVFDRKLRSLYERREYMFPVYVRDSMRWLSAECEQATAFPICG